MFSRVYLNEQEAKDAATLTIQEILGNQNYLDEIKFQKLHTEYRETSTDLESGIQSQILSSINKINQTKNYMDRCQVNLQKCEKAIKELNDEFVKDQKIHREIMKYEKLAIYRRNLGVMLDQMKYLFSVKEQIEQMKNVFESGSDPLGLHTKLLAMSEIRDSIKESINNGSFAKQDMDVILGEFQTLSEFENKFYGSIFSQLEHCLQLSMERPEQLIKVLQIVQSGDKGRTDEKFRKRALASIQKGIDDKFKEKLKEEKEAVVILENCKFTSGDLILVLDHTVRCFPPDYEIFKVYEERYRANIEMRIIPFLEDEDKVAQSFGTLINLLSWVDSYETLLARVGENTNAYEGLRSKVKSYMPIFLDHVTNIIIDYSNKALLNDQQNQQKHAAIEQLIRNKQDLVTYFPEDIFHFINQQFDILGPKLKGEIMIEFIRTVSTSLAEVMRKECTRFINELPVDEDQSEFVSPLYMLILYVNNYYRCMTYSNETKQYCLQFVEQSYQERVEQIIYKDLTSVFNEGISMLLEHCVKLVLNEVGNQLIPVLFTLEWQNQDIVTQSLMTAKDYLNDIEVLVINQIHFNKLVKLVYKEFVSCYIEQFIATMKYLNPNICKGFFPKKLRNVANLTDPSDASSKKVKEKKSKLQIAIGVGLLVPQMQQDHDVLMKRAEQDYMTQLGKTQIQSMDKLLQSVINLFSKPKSEIDGLIQQLAQTAENYALPILEIAFTLRDDCDANLKKNKMELMQKYIVK